MENIENTRRERSPQFPYFGLDKSIGFVRQLYQKGRRSDVRLIDIARTWGFTETSSSLLRTAAALIAFGLVKDSGSGVDRRLAVSDLGLRILEDARPGAKEAAMREAAARVQILRQVRERWGERRPDDDIAISSLKFDFDFGDTAARRFLDVYDETIPYLAGAQETVDEQDEAGSVDIAAPETIDASPISMAANNSREQRAVSESSHRQAWFVANLPNGPTVSVLSDAELTSRNLKSLIRLLSVLLEEMQEHEAEQSSHHTS